MEHNAVPYEDLDYPDEEKLQAEEEENSLGLVAVANFCYVLNKSVETTRATVGAPI